LATSGVPRSRLLRLLRRLVVGVGGAGPPADLVVPCGGDVGAVAPLSPEHTLEGRMGEVAAAARRGRGLQVGLQRAALREAVWHRRIVVAANARQPRSPIMQAVRRTRAGKTQCRAVLSLTRDRECIPSSLPVMGVHKE